MIYGRLKGWPWMIWNRWTGVVNYVSDKPDSWRQEYDCMDRSRPEKYDNGNNFEMDSVT